LVGREDHLEYCDHVTPDRRPSRGGVVAPVLCGCALVAAACSTGPPVNTFDETPTSAPHDTLTVETSKVGPILATAGGRTLYAFAPDSRTTSRCVTSACVFLWPPLVAHGPPLVDAALEQSLVGTIARPDGATQVTYGGHPLYTWNGDTRPGEVSGQAIDNEGGDWYVVAPDGHAITTPFTQLGT
jgi:predicted lipoprotein with Yx(FWY)xxD motif